MASRNSTNSTAHSVDAVTIATLQERVSSLRTDFGVVANDVSSLDSKISELGIRVEDMVTSLSNRFDSAIGQIQSKLEAKTAIPWSALSLGVAIMVALGSVAYLPIRIETGDLKENQIRNDTRVEKLFDRLVPRGEHEEKWRSFESKHQDLKDNILLQVGSLQRQVDTLTKDLGNIYTARDALLENKKRIDQLELLIRGATGGLQHQPQ